MINWTATKAEHAIIQRIAERAVQINPDYEWRTCLMDLEACHCNGMPLDLERLLHADKLNFTHDVFGIARHINRETGHLENCFVPRCALPESVTP